MPATAQNLPDPLPDEARPPWAPFAPFLASALAAPCWLLGRLGWAPAPLMKLFRAIGPVPRHNDLDLALIRLGQNLFPGKGTARVDVEGVGTFECHLKEDWQVLLFLTASYSTAISRVFERVVLPGDTVYDLGANFGWFTLLGARLVGPTGQMHSVEPGAEATTWLRRNVALNGLDERVVVHPVGVTDRTGRARFYRFPALTTVRCSLSRQDEAEAVEEEIEVVTLDDLIRRAGRAPSVIKCDTEGEEFAILSSSRSLLASDARPLWIMEVSGFILGHRGHRIDQVFEMMLGSGYRALLITHEGCIEIDAPALDGDVVFFDPLRHGPRIDRLDRAPGRPVR